MLQDCGTAVHTRHAVHRDGKAGTHHGYEMTYFEELVQILGSKAWFGIRWELCRTLGQSFVTSCLQMRLEEYQLDCGRI